MKYFFNIFCILFFFNSFSQTIEKPLLIVDYTFYNNFLYDEFESTLLVDKSKSIFKNKLSKNESSEPKLKGSGLFIGGKLIDTYYYTNNSTNEIISFEEINGDKVYQISEKIPQFNWNLNYEEIKKINKYTCNKATVSFRGREYTAWYAKEIPVFFGPWKFSGLPGLILEIKDKTNTYHWVASKIKNKNISSFSVPYKKTEKLSLVKFVELRKENLELLRAKVRSKLPKGAEITTPENPRNGLEVLFEWEDKY